MITLCTLLPDGHLDALRSEGVVRPGGIPLSDDSVVVFEFRGSEHETLVDVVADWLVEGAPLHMIVFEPSTKDGFIEGPDVHGHRTWLHRGPLGVAKTMNGFEHQWVFSPGGGYDPGDHHMTASRPRA